MIDKIDLSTIDSSTRPKKTIKKKAEQEAEAATGRRKIGRDQKRLQKEKNRKKKKQKQQEKQKQKSEEPVAKEEPVAEEELPPVIENIKAEKIEGPKILGKIDLPVENDTRPKKMKNENGNVSRSRRKKSSRDTINIKTGMAETGDKADQVVAADLTVAAVAISGRTGGTGGGGGRRPITVAEKINKLTKKKSRKRYRKHRPSLPVAVAEVKA